VRAHDRFFLVAADYLRARWGPFKGMIDVLFTAEAYGPPLE
jgi:hypothetical protein